MGLNVMALAILIVRVMKMTFEIVRIYFIHLNVLTTFIPGIMISIITTSMLQAVVFRWSLYPLFAKVTLNA